MDDARLQGCREAVRGDFVPASMMFYFNWLSKILDNSQE